MKILWRGYASRNHSWSVIAQNISRALIKQGNEVHIFSTNGVKDFPQDLQANLIGYVNEEDISKVYGRIPDQEYDAQFSYTSLKNFPFYFSNGTKNRFGIWCFEWQGLGGSNVLPTGFAKNYKFVDKLLPPSIFAKQIFLDAGVPESAMQVLPHGINVDELNSAQPYQLKTKKSTKIFVNIAQVHMRKNFPALLEMYGKAFTRLDDVCLVIKIQGNSGRNPFELSYQDIVKKFKEKYKQHAEMEIIKDFVPNIYSLYKACDVCFSASHCEAFGMTALEAAASGLVNLATNYGGFIDFMNDSNSFLINGSIVRADPRSMYWESKPNSVWFEPSISDAVDKLRFICQNKVSLLEKSKEHAKYIIENYSWDNVVKQVKFNV